MSYVFKARIKQPNSKAGSYVCAVYDDNTFQFYGHAAFADCIRTV